jgi:hypothetical protein
MMMGTPCCECRHQFSFLELVATEIIVAAKAFGCIKSHHCMQCGIFFDANAKVRLAAVCVDADRSLSQMSFSK